MSEPQTSLPPGYKLNRIENFGTYFKATLNNPNTTCDFASWTTFGRGRTEEKALSDAIRNIQSAEPKDSQFWIDYRNEGYFREGT